MTAAWLQALRDEIVQRVDEPVIASRDTEAIAGAVSVGRVRATAREIGNGLVLETLGLATGNTVLDLVHASADMRHVRVLLEQGRLVASSPLVAAWFAGLVTAGIVTQAQADAIVALGFEPAPVSELDVRRACWSDAGEWLVWP